MSAYFSDVVYTISAMIGGLLQPGGGVE